MLISKRYQLVTEIYKAATTEIWSAIDIRNDEEEVMIKILRFSNADEQLLVKELFRREAESLSRIRHENIITYKDSGVENNLFYIVTEWFEADNLYQYINNNPDISYEKKIKIMLDILSGLSEAHKNKVVHRDLKPTNVLVDIFENVKIIDFGISKILGVTYNNNQTLKDMMTVAYASPEQLLRGNISFTSDFYSVGCLFYYLLTAQDPPEDKGSLLTKIDPINCSNSIKELLTLLLQNDSSKRPDNIHQIINVVRSEYMNLLSRRTKLYLKIKGQISKDLYSLGKIRQMNIESAISFISNDLEQSVIYKNNNNYYLIGNSLKYHCKLSPDQSCFIVGLINNLDDDFNLKEQELRRGIRVYAKWFVVKNMQEMERSEALSQVLLHVNDEERKRKVSKAREDEENKLLKKWDDYLQDEKLIIQEKKRLCKYSNFIYDEMSGKLVVTVDNSDVGLEKNDLIQLTSKNGTSQITVGVLDSIEQDNVIINIKPNVNLEEISTRGKLGLDLVQAEASLKRLQNATRAVTDGRTVNPNLIEIIRDPELATMNSIIERKNFIQTLDFSNKVAVNKALSTKDVFLIQGPPGTGKTTVITEIILKILEEDPEARILLASQSHVAVDHALANIVKHIGKHKAIRVGRLEKISEESESLLMTNQVNRWVAQVRETSKKNFQIYLESNFTLSEEQIGEKMSQIEKFNENLEQDHSTLTLNKNEKKLYELTNITREWHKRLGNLDEFDEIFAQNASVVAATCLGIASRHILNEMAFDWVIVDEAARATTPELLVPLVRGKKIILVGDHKQLPPVVNSNIEQYKKEEKGLRKSDLEKSLFEELFERISDEAKIVLTSQFRMHPTIGQLINDVFYPTENIVSKKLPQERQHFLDWWPKTIIWLNTHGLANNIEQNVGVSKRNDAEATVISKLLSEIENIYGEKNIKASVAVISGYDAQRSIITNLVQPNDNKKWKNLKIQINNVDAFQGSESDIAIYSIVRNNSKGKIGFLDDARRLNVALSRGKTCLILVGDAKFAERARVIGRNPFVDVIDFIRNYPNNCLLEDLR
ncbi:serine/threonine-protein kinase [Paenibacillus sp. J14]|uniref:serine/threonine-protein kinase n=1 Tax=Paenibacillus sp. (strain J14) TaxID=935845 RepID=UPI0006863C82|nr:serine/threonine-protein kinase [Paenibacillus sp. J14]